MKNLIVWGYHIKELTTPAKFMPKTTQVDNMNLTTFSDKAYLISFSA